MSSLHQRLRTTAANHAFLRLLGALLVSLAGASLALLLLAFLDTAAPLQETTAVWLIAAIALLGAATAAVLMHFAWHRRPHERELARRVELRHPELLDSLNTAAKEDLSGPFAASVTSLAEARTRGLDFTKLTLPPYARGPFPYLAALLAAGLAFASLFTTPVEKAFRAVVGPPGIELLTTPLEAAEGGDFTLKASLHRWQRQASISYRQRGQWHTHAVVVDPQGNASFTFYEVNEPIPFTLRTPSLSTGELTLSTFNPPELERARVVITPPAYTGLEPETLETLGDIRAVQGTRLEFSLTARADNATYSDDTPLELDLGAADGRNWNLTTTVSEDSRYRFSLRRGDRLTQTPLHAIDAYPDEPPLVEILEPADDITAPPGASIPLEIFLSDDFGLGPADLIVSRSGEQRTRYALTIPADAADGKKGTAQSLSVAALIDLEDLAAANGDLVSYFVVATDNRQPEPNVAKSEVFFIDVVEDQEPIRIPGQEGMEREELDLQPFIVEMKRLLRQTHAALGDPTTDRERAIEIGADLGGLRNRLSGLSEELQPALEGMGQAHLMEHFATMLDQIENAERLASGNLLAQAIPPQEKALSAMLKLLSALRRNVITESNQQRQSGQSGQSESSGEQPQQQPQMSALEAQRQALAAAERLLQQQSALNQQVNRAQRTGADPAELAELALQQAELEQATQALAGALDNLPLAQRAGQSLSEAASEMSEGATSLGEGDASGGLLQGERAREKLAESALLLEDALGQSAGLAMQALSEAAQSLAAQQQALAEKTQQAQQSGNVPGELSDRQRQLGEQLEQLLQGIEGTAGELSRNFPEASRALAEIGRQARGRETGRAIDRAANALLYERLQRALPLQQQSSRDLRDLSAMVENARGDVPAVTASQLQRLLGELARDSRELQALSGGSEEERQRTQQLADRWEGRLEQLAQALQDARLNQAAGALSYLGEGAGDVPGEVSATLREAGQLLRQYTNAAQRDRQLLLNRQAAPPPDGYRDRVEAYFRALSEAE